MNKIHKYIRVIKRRVCVKIVVLTYGKLLLKNLADRFAFGKNTAEYIRVRSNFCGNRLGKAFLFINDGKNGRSDKRDNHSYSANSRKHSVNSFTGFIMLIISDVCLNCRIENQGK